MGDTLGGLGRFILHGSMSYATSFRLFLAEELYPNSGKIIRPFHDKEILFMFNTLVHSPRYSVL